MMKRHKKSNKKQKGLSGSSQFNNKHRSTETERDRTEGCGYRIEKSEVFGRFLVASQNFAPGEVILNEKPIVVGPCQESKPLCIGCYSSIDLTDKNSFCRCTLCGWPLCSAKCPGQDQTYGHSLAECHLLCQTNVNKTPAEFLTTSYYAITPLRCLALKEGIPDLWAILETMESHNETRKGIAELWNMNQKMAVERIRNVWGLTQFSEEEIHTVCGVLEVNAFEVASSGPQPLRAVYPKAFLLAHDCVPNTSHSDGAQFELTVRAAQCILAGTAMTVSYTYTLQSTLKRRKHLQETKFFSCCCRRCKDPTELRTYAGAMKCSLCRDGLVLPTNPLDNDADWKCISSKCHSERIAVSSIIPFLDRLSTQLDSIDGNDVTAYETFLTRHSEFLHENHYHCLAALHCLSQLYGKISGYLINDLTDAQLERKMEICRQLLRMFDKLEPRFSKQRGILLYELQAPLMVLTTRRIERKNILEKELKMKLKEVVKYLEESWTILSKEPKNSPEAEMAEAAKQALIGECP